MCCRIADPGESRGHAVHPFDHMKTSANLDLAAALARAVPHIDMERVFQIVESVLEEAAAVL